jgi:hypothetical protein
MGANMLKAPFSRSEVHANTLVIRQNASDIANNQSQFSITAASDGYWLNDLSGKGYAAFNSNPGSYKVFRNVKDYGARGE